MRSVGKVIQSSIALGLAMATASTGGGMRLQVLHTGAGVARREAYQDRRAEDRAVLDQVDAEAVLRAESATQRIVRVEAGSIVVDAEGANYALHHNMYVKLTRERNANQKCRANRLEVHIRQRAYRVYSAFKKRTANGWRGVAQQRTV